MIDTDRKRTEQVLEALLRRERDREAADAETMALVRDEVLALVRATG